MSLARFLIAGVATTMLSGTAFANDYYRCNDHYCYDDQADETRELNRQQLENPGAGMDAVPPPGDDGYSNEGQGGPYYEAPDQDDGYGPGPDDRDDYGPPSDGPDNYDSPDDDDDQSSPPPDDQYPGDDQ